MKKADRSSTYHVRSSELWTFPWSVLPATFEKVSFRLCLGVSAYGRKGISLNIKLALLML